MSRTLTWPGPPAHPPPARPCVPSWASLSLELLGNGEAQALYSRPPQQCSPEGLVASITGCFQAWPVPAPGQAPRGTPQPPRRRSPPVPHARGSGRAHQPRCHLPCPRSPPCGRLTLPFRGSHGAPLTARTHTFSPVPGVGSCLSALLPGDI